MGFYCDNCGEKVEINSNECPRCGVLFKAVKCPRCDFTGAAESFRKGCPSCGYQAPTFGKKTPPSDWNHKNIPKRFISDKTFWILGILLLLTIPVLLAVLFQS